MIVRANSDDVDAEAVVGINRDLALGQKMANRAIIVGGRKSIRIVAADLGGFLMVQAGHSVQSRAAKHDRAVSGDQPDNQELAASARHECGINLGKRVVGGSHQTV